jgi:methylisocitrate lyase
VFFEADIDTGGGNAVNAAWVTERLISMGVAGMNIEDQIFPKRCGHMAGKEVFLEIHGTFFIISCFFFFQKGYFYGRDGWKSSCLC